MTFKQYITRNNIKGKLDAGLSPTTTTLILKPEYTDIFPDTTTERKYQVTLEHYDIDNNVDKREIVLVTNKVSNVLTIQRSAGYCLASYNATAYTNTAFGFSEGDDVSMYITSENDDDIKDELVRLDGQILTIFESISDEDLETTYNVDGQLEQIVDNKNGITANLTWYDTPTGKIEIQIVGDPKKYTVLYDGFGILETVVYA